MARKSRHAPLRVLLNNRLVGYLRKDPGGAIEFRYDQTWLDREQAIPVSLSLPLREDAFRGGAVVAVFDNLLPDSDQLRQKVAAKVDADGIDAYSLLSQIGRDCVGALQFIPDDEPSSTNSDPTLIQGDSIDEHEIEAILKNLVQAPLGLGREQTFRISVAGAHEKTALLLHEGQWLKPRGTTPTTHLFKTAIGVLHTGYGDIDMSASVENEWYCLRLLQEFGMSASDAEIATFGKTKALVVRRFDRRWTESGRLLRLPQEDFCQALSVPPSKKYQAEGGPGMVAILDLLKGSDFPAEDQKNFLKAQIVYWLIGATDGHAKNFSIFLASGGRFRLTPFYDALTLQPGADAGQIKRKDMTLAMYAEAGKGRQYAMEHIAGRHFVWTAERAGLSAMVANQALEEVSRDAGRAVEAMERQLPIDFPEIIHLSVKKALNSRLAKIV